MAALKECIEDENNQKLLSEFRTRRIAGKLAYKSKDKDNTSEDDDNITTLFDDFLQALEIDVNGEARRTAVGVAKALHLLAPDFFPLWDRRIAEAYNCDYAKDRLNAYLCFMGKIRDIAGPLAKSDMVKALVRQTGLSLVKLIDEYNYVTYTLGDE